MSAIVAAAVGLGAIAYLSMGDPQEEETQSKAKKAAPDGSLNTQFNSGSIYTDTRDAREIMDSGVHFVSEERGQDLSGVECRWLKMQNGVIVKTYDMQTQFVGFV